MRRISHSRRQGIVLLIALGMLTLFSIMIISYVITTGQVASITELDQADEQLPSPFYLDEAMGSLLYGTEDPQSASHGNSLLEDLYGYDGLLLRVGNRRAGAPASWPAMPVNSQGLDSRGFLLRPLNGTDFYSGLFKFPTSLADWHFDGTTPPEGVVTNILNISAEVRNFDDSLSGRYLTFLEGPLQNTTFRIVRSFGGSNTKDPDDQGDATDIERDLAGSVVIDLEECPVTEVEVNGVLYDLTVTAQGAPGQLIYNPGEDGSPGRAGVDDDGDNVVDEEDELGFPGTDDYGYRFVVNGAPFNGNGRNSNGVSGVASNTGSNDAGAEIELQFNSSLIGSTPKAMGAPQLVHHDEPWDAADFENLFLAWQPSDHRGAYDVGLYGGGTDLDQHVGAEIIPSFHRPAVINYLMNTPIRLSQTDFNAPTFSELTGTDPQDLVRLRALATRLRRATMRPLNFDHLFGDLNNDGIGQDGDPGFTGSNPAPIHGTTISRGDSFNRMKSNLLQLARWMANGPWDVDNDGDGIPDSVWVDLGLPSFTTSTGLVVRPMIAPLVEDLDGRINVNEAGNYRQLLSSKFASANNNFPNGYAGDNQYLKATQSLNLFGRGGGVGPAEIDFSHLFNEGRTIEPGYFGPIYHNQTSNAQNRFLYTTYGNLLNTRYGGSVVDYSVDPVNLLNIDLKYPGFGDDSNSVAQHRLQDQYARIPHPTREEIFSSQTSPVGSPMDLSGMSLTRKDHFGNPRTDHLDESIFNDLNDVLNQPYENGVDDDRDFTARDFQELVDGFSGGDLLGELLREEIVRNDSLRSLITVESRSLDVPEFTGFANSNAFFLSKMSSVPANQRQIHLDRILAPELRKNAKLNLNRAIGNGRDDLTAFISSLTDEAYETKGAQNPRVINRQAPEAAFPQIADQHPTEAAVLARYAPLVTRELSQTQLDFNGLDLNGDGVLDSGTDVNGDGFIDQVAGAKELLARHLYVLMFFLIENETNGVYVPEFPYPEGFSTDAGIKNKYVARRLAQWAVNVVDFRDGDASCTRLRYDPNPFDGFALDVAANHVVWGMERPEIEISESLAFHDKRLRRNLEKEKDQDDPTVTLDGELPEDEDDDPQDAKDPDSDMDQFRIPQGSAFVELRSLRSPADGSDQQQPLPAELYTSGRLDLGRIVGAGARRSPVWRLAVGEAVRGDLDKSVRWLFDADRLGQKLAVDLSSTEQLEYLTNNAPADWEDQVEVGDYLDTWREAQRVAAEIRPSVKGSTQVGEYVTLSDDDFDPTNDDTSAHRVQLSRFVWFTHENDLKPNNSLFVINSPLSGMKLQNTYFNRADTEKLGAGNSAAIRAQLLPGQFAVIAPRPETRLGQKTDCLAPLYPYSPSPQRLGLARQSGGGGQYYFKFHDLVDDDADPETPRYWQDGNQTANAHYHVNTVLPIIAQSFTPADSVNNQSWRDYLNNTGPNQQVEIGFNISEPLADDNYYDPPTHRITLTGIDNGPGYPLVDGYRDYDNEQGFHPDEPFDHRGLGGGAGAPLAQNNWAAVGTHQEAVAIFLQRLADPSAPWHPVDNPYVTVDLSPMDLTTFNGEGDVTEEIDRDGNGNMEIADSASSYDAGSQQFNPAVRFDSRRKIPDTSRDRASTHLVQRAADPQAPALQNYQRQVFTERPALSASFSLLRSSATAGSNSVWDYALGSMWNDSHQPIDTSIDSSYRYDATWEPYHPGMDTEPYRQTLGFVNREYGRPIGADNGSNQDAPDVGRYGRGTPRGTRFIMPEWDNRDFQSPLMVMHVPASSQTSLLREFTTGTVLQDEGKRERVAAFNHLLGFENAFAEPSGDDTPQSGWQLERAAPIASSQKELTGPRAPFELILDFVDTGQVDHENNYWFLADRVQFVPENNNRDRMFNRIVELLQPPFNYVPGLRTAGKVNLNTSPDYIRKGGNGPSLASGDFLDSGEFPHNSNASGVGNVQRASIVTNRGLIGADCIASNFYGNGSIYRSLSWANSTYYDLDDVYGSPTVLGQPDAYQLRVDTRYGRGFKAFIESRRGYDTSSGSRSSGTSLLLNPSLDWRYPTRFAGMFSTAMSAEIPSVQRFMLRKKNGTNNVSAVRRRTHDMGLLRPHPDFDERLFSNTEQNDFNDETNTSAYSLLVESDPTGSSVTLPPITTVPEVDQLRMVRANQPLFDRSLPELHKDFRHQARSSRERTENSARMFNKTTNHSNVFLVRMTVGYFVVDPSTGAVGAEYLNRQGVVTRASAAYVVDRSIPVGFVPGEKVNTDQAILYSVLK